MQISIAVHEKRTLPFWTAAMKEKQRRTKQMRSGVMEVNQ